MMEEHSIFHRMISHLRSTCKYYTGYPKDLGPSRVIHFTSEREFVHILHQGYPVVVAFTIRGNLTKHLDRVLEEAAAEFYPHVKFMRVECPKYPGFCLTRQRKEYPFIEIFHSPEQASTRERGADPNITKYAVKVLPFNYDLSAYGFREYFKRQGIRHLQKYLKTNSAACASSARSPVQHQTHHDGEKTNTNDLSTNVSDCDASLLGIIFRSFCQIFRSCFCRKDNLFPQDRHLLQVLLPIL